MNPVWIAALVGATFGAGVVALWVGATRRTRRLADVAGTLEHGVAVAGGDGPRFWRSEIERTRARWGSALELCEQTPQKFLAGRLLLSIEFSALPVVVWLAGRTGLLPQFFDFGVMLAAILAGGVLGWFVAGLSLRNEVKQRRDEWNAALSALVELIGLLVAGGSGIETATEEAASAGRGQVFRHINAAITAATTRREPPWPSLRNLGERLGIDDLVEFSESMALASDGARVADALVARAVASRERDLSRELARAESMSESMVVPVSLMLAGIFVMIGFPIMVSMTTL